jgi:hypothetical protein
MTTRKDDEHGDELSAPRLGVARSVVAGRVLLQLPPLIGIGVALPQPPQCFSRGRPRRARLDLRNGLRNAAASPGGGLLRPSGRRVRDHRRRWILACFMLTVMPSRLNPCAWMIRAAGSGTAPRWRLAGRHHGVASRSLTASSRIRPGLITRGVRPGWCGCDARRLRLRWQTTGVLANPSPGTPPPGTHGPQRRRIDRPVRVPATDRVGGTGCRGEAAAGLHARRLLIPLRRSQHDGPAALRRCLAGRGRCVAGGGERSLPRPSWLP